MRIADIFVLSSLSEGAPNVLMEASSSGLPLVTTDVGEASQIVINGKTGIVVLPKDVNSLTNAMILFVEDRPLSKKMGETGRIRVERYYSWEIICNKLFNKYQSIVDISHSSNTKNY